MLKHIELQEFGGSTADEPSEVEHSMPQKCCRRREPAFRRIHFDGRTNWKGPENAVKNTKYNLFTFLPLFLYYQFNQPLNLFFLVIALTQFYPPLQVGFLFTYVAPLVIVLSITLAKEAYDDLVRWRRDCEINRTTYTKVTPCGRVFVKAAQIRPGDLIEVRAHERVPADLVLLHTTEASGAVFIKTDQLDGETDWKLRTAVSFTQNSVQDTRDLASLAAVVVVQRPHQNIYAFEGRFKTQGAKEGLGLDNTMWANTTLTAGTCTGLVVYTGAETRSAMNSDEPANKLGVTDSELNKLAMYLLLVMLVLSGVALLLGGLNRNSGVLFFRYLLLLSSIIPISLRVNLDFAKIFYCWTIARDERVGYAQPRNSTIPEELGRVHMLLSDKTGTLTTNEMKLKRISLEQFAFDENSAENMNEFTDLVNSSFRARFLPLTGLEKKKRQPEALARDMVTALAVCHNVSTVRQDGCTQYQASSPDEICLVEFAQAHGIELVHRDPQKLVLRTPAGEEHYDILELFPFTSARKRMGVIVQHVDSGQIIFYMKGAETVIEPMMLSETAKNIMQEECENLGMEGLRTLAFVQRILSPQECTAFQQRYRAAKESLANRALQEEEVRQSLEHQMHFIGVTGVEDRLQDNVDVAIETLRAAGVKIWMITGDKVETAQCIAISTRIFHPRHHTWFKLVNLQGLGEIQEALSHLQPNCVVLIDGNTLNIVLEYLAKEFVTACANAEAVVCCRASPTQKSRVVTAITTHTTCRVCAIGDGGNDVGMIQAAHIGIGIEGKEGMQASLAADFSVSEFQYLTPLLLWHGRLSYLRTSKLSNFIFHRGLIIAVIQFLFCAVFYSAAIPIYNGYLILGYTTIFTSMPVFSLVLDRDSTFETVKRNAKLYQTLQLGRGLNALRFLVWIWKSLYQGSVILLLSLVLFPQSNFFNIVGITFSALILTELLNVATIIQTWNRHIVTSELFTLLLFAVCVGLLKDFFDLAFIVTADFVAKVGLITLAAWLPMHVLAKCKERWFPDEGRKLRQANY